MTRPCLSCWPHRSRRPDGARISALPGWLRGPLAAGCASVLIVAGAAAVPEAVGGDGCGTVRGSVAVEQAALRTEGPKHDLDVVIFLDPVGGGGPPPVAAAAEMDQRGLVFIPHVLAIQRGTTVTFLNNDNDDHNVYFLDDRTGETLDIGTWGQGVAVDHTFADAGTVITLCKLHLEMAAYIVVVESPWFTRITLDPASRWGTFAIEDVPPGEYELGVWHKKLKKKGGTTRVNVTTGAAVDVDAIITKAKYAENAGT